MTASIAALAARYWEARSTPRTTRPIAARSGGNALFARELCLSGRDAGAIAVVDGRWTLVGRSASPSRLVELVRARIDDLPDPERGPLDLIAHGEPIGQASRRRSSVPTRFSRWSTWLIVLREDGRRREVWLSHPMLRRGPPGDDRCHARGALKGRLAGGDGRDGYASQIRLRRVATWQLEAGTGDPELLRRAATETYRASDMAGTARFAAGAWDLHPDADLATLLATALAYMGRLRGGGRDLRRRARPSRRDDATLDPDPIVHAAIRPAGLGQPDAAIRS